MRAIPVLRAAAPTCRDLILDGTRYRLSSFNLDLELEFEAKNQQPGKIVLRTLSYSLVSILDNCAFRYYKIKHIDRDRDIGRETYSYPSVTRFGCVT